jgi:hypothetical protein
MEVHRSSAVNNGDVAEISDRAASGTGNCCPISVACAGTLHRCWRPTTIHFEILS